MGYAEAYHRPGFRILHEVRYIAFILSYFLFQILLFMLIYKFRKRIYRKIFEYIKGDAQKTSLFWSFVFTTVIAFVAMIYMVSYDYEFCITVLEITLISGLIIFILLHAFVVCFRLKFNLEFFPSFSYNKCTMAVNYFLQFLVMLYLLLLPHVLLLIIIILSTNFFQNPLSYIVLSTYFILSLIILWIVNALAIYLIIPLMYFHSCCCQIRCKNKNDCRHCFFAVLLFSAINLLNFTIWSFISTYFYDKRGNVTSYLSLVPGVVISLIGWYLSGNLYKIFNAFSRKGNENTHLHNGYIDYQDESNDRHRSLSFKQKLQKNLMYVIRRPSFTAKLIADVDQADSELA